MSKSADRAPVDFSSAASEQQPGAVRQFVDFMLHNKKWWLVPIILALLMVGGLIILGGTAAAPLIYTLF
jgi:hypothetical protein